LGAAADLRLRPRGHHDRHIIAVRCSNVGVSSLMLAVKPKHVPDN
jgi:hypothetical protein